MQTDTLFASYRDRLEDFWARRQSQPRFERTTRVFDRSVVLLSNHDQALAAIDFCLPQYSTAPAAELPAFSIQLVVQAGPRDPGPAPDDLMEQLHYTGEAQWLAIRMGTWGHCHVDLERGRAVAVLEPRLAQQPEVVGRCLLNTVLTNFFIAGGYAMLHASCLFHKGRAVLLMAGHNSGKSTTALQLALAGYPLLSDSMIFLSPASEELLLFGFPVGKIKLRQDMVPAFPQVREFLAPENVRDEIKHSLDLRQLDPALVCEEAVSPAAIELCLLERGRGRDTLLTPASRPAVEASVMQNSLFYDTDRVWRRNLAGIERLLEAARWHHLVIGTDQEQIAEAVETLWRAP